MNITFIIFYVLGRIQITHINKLLHKLLFHFIIKYNVFFDDCIKNIIIYIFLLWVNVDFFILFWIYWLFIFYIYCIYGPLPDLTVYKLL